MLLSSYNSAGLSVGRSLGTAQGPQHGEGSGHVFEGVSLGASSSDIKELPKEHHGGVGLPGAAGPGEDDGLGVAGLSLHPDGLLGHAVEILSRPGRLSGGVESDGVAHIVVRIDGEKDRANIGLETVGIESKV